MGRLINIGFGNCIHTDKVIAIVNPDAAPIKRMIQRAKEQGTLIDATQGRKTKAAIIAENNFVIVSALLPETITKRFNNYSDSFTESKEELEYNE